MSKIAESSIRGLADLSNESRVITTPWSRMLRGIALGQYPVDYDTSTAELIQATFERLVKKVSTSDHYTNFGHNLSDFILRDCDPSGEPVDRRASIGKLIESIHSVSNPYYRVMAGSILMDTVAKLGMDASMLVNETHDLPDEMLSLLDEISPDAIADENQGRHGEYERVFASSAVFLALGQLGLADRLVTAERNYIVDALNLLVGIPIPYFCGRAAGTLMSAITVLGFSQYVYDGDRDYMEEVLRYLLRAESIGNWPEFHNHITTSWKKVYPILTMMNAIALGGRHKYLTEPFDVLQESAELMEDIPWEIRLHMAQYYIIALHNLGRLGDQIPDLDSYVGQIATAMKMIDPGENYSPRGNAYPYAIEIAMMTGNLDLIPDSALERMVDSFPDLNGATDIQNRPFPVSYVLNVLAEIGSLKLVLAPRARYSGASALDWVVDNLSEGARVEGDRVSMITHALVSISLQMRGSGAQESPLYRDFEFPMTANGIDLSAE